MTYQAGLSNSEIVTGQLDRDLGLNRLVEVDLLEVEVLEIAAHRVVLLLLDHDRNRIAAFDVKIEQRVAFTQDHPGVATFDLKGGRFLAVRVDDPGDLAVTAEALGDSGAEIGTGCGVECCSI